VAGVDVVCGVWSTWCGVWCVVDLAGVDVVWCVVDLAGVDVVGGRPGWHQRDVWSTWPASVWRGRWLDLVVNVHIPQHEGRARWWWWERDATGSSHR